MPSLFDDEPSEKKSLSIVVNGELWCDTCFTVVDHGDYYPEAETLVFVCPNEHENIVRGMKL